MVSSVPAGVWAFEVEVPAGSGMVLLGLCVEKKEKAVSRGRSCGPASISCGLWALSFAVSAVVQDALMSICPTDCSMSLWEVPIVRRQGDPSEC